MSRTAARKPGSLKEITTYANGSEVLIDWVYVRNGKYWGITPIGHSWMNPGWVQMDQLLVMYINDDFNNEHRNEFYTYSGSYDAALTAEKLVIWEWPGSDRAKRILDYSSWIGESASMTSNPSSDKGLVVKDISADFAYMDDDGREWGFVTITYTYSSWEEFPFRAGQNVSMKEWICLSDPQSSDIFPFNPAPASIMWIPEGNLDWTPDSSPDRTTESNVRLLVLLIILLLAISAGTVIIIRILRSRKSDNA